VQHLRIVKGSVSLTDNDPAPENTKRQVQVYPLWEVMLSDTLEILTESICVGSCKEMEGNMKDTIQRGKDLRGKVTR
jgi:hypothetical protein